MEMNGDEWRSKRDGFIYTGGSFTQVLQVRTRCDICRGEWDGQRQSDEKGDFLSLWNSLVFETFDLCYNAAPTQNPSSSGNFFFGLILYWQR